jgi:hypothetical protein
MQTKIQLDSLQDSDNLLHCWNLRIQPAQHHIVFQAKPSYAYQAKKMAQSYLSDI